MIYMQDAPFDRARDNERLRTDMGLWATCRTCIYVTNNGFSRLYIELRVICSL